MSSPFTDDQRKAIDARGTDLLVAASAGSGKTTVLVERILHIITNDQKPVDIDRLLIVTFTEAAAAEMRQRISNKISAALASESGNEHLARQIMLIPNANISTIHAFCRKVMKRYFHTIDLDPEFRVGDETELQLLRYQLLEEIFENEYSFEDNLAFTDLVESYGGGKTRDEGLSNLVLKLYNFVESTPYPEHTLNKYLDMYEDAEENLDGSIWANVLRAEIKRELEGALIAVRQCIQMSYGPMGPIKYIDTLQDDEMQVLFLMKQLSKPLAEIYTAVQSIEFSRLYGYRRDVVSEELKSRVKDIRKTQYKDRIQKLKSDFFFKHPDIMGQDVRALNGLIKKLSDITLKFMQSYTEAKRERGLVDFNDLEHYCIEILYSGNPESPEPTKAAHELSAWFEEVMIDEYQDSNLVQELILTAVSRTRFMVGDVKQSIYKFRRANPYLFIEKYDWYANPQSDGLRVDLSMNFRSRVDVLNAVNYFFSRIMTKEVGEIVYDNHAALHSGAVFPNEPNPGMYAAEFNLIEYVKQSKEPEKNANELLSDISKASAEAEIVGQRILSYLNPNDPLMVTDNKLLRPCKKSDIVILLRSERNIGRIFVDVLKNLDIEAKTGIGTNFFESVEVQTALSFLQIIDNPRQDVFLITVLHSPVYGFTPDELLELRYVDADKTFFECVELAGDQKTERFLQDLSRWRDKSIYMCISDLLSLVYDDTNYYNIVGALPGGTMRQSNLRELLDRAVRYEDTSFKGLFHFIRYMEHLQKSGAEIRSIEPEGESVEDQVRIMTIHQSKGLEFPVVFVSMLGKQFNRQDEREKVIFHQGLGIGAVYVNTEKRTKTETLPRFAAARRIRLEALSEELRVLYVAMTRAKDKLVLTGCVDRLEKRLEKWRYAASLLENTLPEHYLATSQNYLDFLTPCLVEGIDKGGLFSVEDAQFDIRLHTSQSRSIVKREDVRLSGLRFDALKDIEASQNHSGREAEIAQALWWTYPFATEQDLPSKVSISEIKRIYYSEMTGGTENVRKTQPTFNPPAFLSKDKKQASMYRGTAIHTVLEHMDLNRHIDEHSVKSLVSGLIAANILPEDTKSIIPIKRIVSYARSSLADRIRSSTNVQREIPFVLGLPAKDIYSKLKSDETILVHGIIDCWFEENGNIILVDYKSDSMPAGGLEELISKYQIQMKIYAEAIERTCGQAPSEVLLYLFSINTAVQVDI